MRYRFSHLSCVVAFAAVAITKLDVLDGLEELHICTGYKLDGKVLDLLPIGADEVARCEPIYETMPGWTETTFGAKRWEDLPATAQAYLDRIQTLCEIPIDIVSTGPERDESVDPWRLPHGFRRSWRTARQRPSRL